MDDALRLAEELKKFWGDYASLEKVNRAADLLRSQHAEIIALRAEVERLRPTCPYCKRLGSPGWTDDETRAGKRYIDGGTLQFHCYAAKCLD